MNQSLFTSLETSKKLKEAGYLQEGCEAYYVECILVGIHIEIKEVKPNGFMLLSSEFIESHETELKPDLIKYAAPQAQEILERLPYMIEEDYAFLTIKKSIEGDYSVNYMRNGGVVYAFQWHKNLADACGQMYLYLKAHNLLKEGE